MDELQLMTGLRINPIIAPLSVVESRLDALYRPISTPRASARGPRNSTWPRKTRQRRREHPQSRRHAPRGRQRPDHPHGQPDPRAGAAQRRQRHPPRAIRGRLQVPPADRRRAPRASPAVEERLHHDHLPLEGPGEDGHRRETHPPGRRHRAADRRQADRPPRQHGPHGLRREDGDANPGQGGHPPEPHRLGPRRAAVDRPDRVDPLAVRPGTGDRPDRQRQVDHALFLPQPAQ